MRQTLTHIAFALALVASSVTPSLADARDDARRAFAAGEAADRRGDYEAALGHYQRAFERVPHHFAAYNIAVDLERLARYRDAAAWFRRYLDMAPDAQDRDAVQRVIRELALRPAKLTVTSRPMGARVSIDGHEVGVTPVTRQLGGGRHSVTVELDGERDDRDVVLEYGEPSAFEVVLREVADLAGTPPARPAPIGPSGTLDVRGTPVGARIMVDDQLVGTVPAQVPVAVGEHRVVIVSDGRPPFETTVAVTENQVVPVSPQLAAQDARLRAGLLLGLVAGADLRGEGMAYMFELGLRGLGFDLGTRWGRIGGLTPLDLYGRWAFGTARLAPFVGFNYSYTGGSASGWGYGAMAGVRYDLVRGATTTTTVAAEAGVRIHAGVVDAPPGDADTQMTTKLVPLMLTVQLVYGKPVSPR